MKPITTLNALALILICTSAAYIKSNDCSGLASKQCPGCDFTNCNMTSYASFTHAKFSGANFSGQNLSNKDFSYADLSNANFHNTNLTNVNFTGADFEGADLTGAFIQPNTNFNYANLRGSFLNPNVPRDQLFGQNETMKNFTLKKGTRWPSGGCPDNRCFSGTNKATVILNKIDNQSDTDYVIATSDAPINELINELESSTVTGSSLLITWLQVYLRSPEDPDPVGYIKLSKSDRPASITGKYELRFCGESSEDKPLIAKAKTVNEYTTFPDVSSDIGPTGTYNQTIILFPKNLAGACRHVILLGRWKDQGVGTNIFVVYTYATYHNLNPCIPGMTKDTKATAEPLKLNTNTSPLNIGKGGHLALVIGSNKTPTSLIATAA